LLLLLLSFPVIRDASLTAQLLPRRTITRVVALDGQTESSLLIGYSLSDAAGKQHGNDIARVLKEQFGANAAVVPADDIVPEDYKRRTIILLGNIVGNREILWLYSFNYSFADAAYPGHDGYVIRQIHDPMGGGRNALLVGASSDAGLARGVARFITELNQLNQPVWNKDLIVDSDLDVITSPPAQLDNKERDELHEESLKRMEGGELWNEAHAIIHAARAWYLSGNDVYLQRYDTMTHSHRELTNSQADQFYGGLEFWLPAYIQAWDIVEESEFWTDTQRQQKTQLLFDLTQVLAARYNRFSDKPSPRIRWNHETHPSLAYFYLSEYLFKYYGGAKPAPDYRRLARLVLGGQTHFVRGTDESGLYLPYAPASALRYAIASRQYDMITSGRAEQFGHLLQMMTDNTGRFVGAANRESASIAYYYQLPLVTILGEDVMSGLDRKTRLAIERPTEPRDDWGVKKRFGEYRPPLNKSSRLSGLSAAGISQSESIRHVEAFPIDEGLYTQTNTEAFYSRVPLVKSQVPYSRSFDKLVFREGFGKTEQYLLLDGYGRGKHYRYDTNAILRFTTDDRVFLVGTDDDQRVAETFHNTLTFIRDGRGHAHVPPFAELEAVADLPNTGFSISTVDDYAGLKWTRNIVWLKGSLFVVVDQVEAQTDGQYTLRCHWNGLGKITVDDAAIHLEQNGRICTVSGDGRTNISVAEDRSAPASLWAGYPHADPVIQRVRQTRTLKLRQGERASISNLIFTHDSVDPPLARCHASTPDHLVFSDGDQHQLLCMTHDAVPAPFSIDANLVLFDGRRISLVQATSLRIGETECFRATEPVDCELDVVTQTVSLSRQSRGKQFTWTPSPDLQSALATVITNVRKNTTSQLAVRETVTNPLKTSETELAYKVLTAIVPDAGADSNQAIVVGTSNGCRSLHVDNEAKVNPDWHFSTNSPITALTRSRRNSAGAAILYGTDAGDIALLSSNGQEQWHRRLTGTQRLSRQVTCLLADDIDLDGQNEVIAGTGLWNVHAFDDGGRDLWNTSAYARRILSLAAGALSGNGEKDLVIGTSYYTLSAYNARGQVLFAYTGEPRFQHVLVNDLDADQQPEVIAANANRLVVLDVQRDRLQPRTYVKGMNLPRASSVRFQFDAGDEVNSVMVVDSNTDTSPAIIAGTESGYVYCFDAHGKLLHLRNAGDAIRALASGQDADGRSIIVAALSNHPVVVVMDVTLKPIGRAIFKHPVRWISVRTDGVLCVTPKSVGIITGANE